jgi:hypothetical protein
MIACLADKSLFAPFMFEGHCDAKLFEYYVEEIVIKALEANQVLIIHNDSFHKLQRINFLVEGSRCETRIDEVGVE